jgi:hypothetical protein
VGRAWATKRRIARRLGSTDPHDHDLPSKPPWMRGATYDVSPNAMMPPMTPWTGGSWSPLPACCGTGPTLLTAENPG